MLPFRRVLLVQVLLRPWYVKSAMFELTLIQRGFRFHELILQQRKTQIRFVTYLLFALC